MRELLLKQIEDVKRDALTRIISVETHLVHIRNLMDKEMHLNDLGELQGLACMLDCRLANLSCLMRLKDNLDEQLDKDLSDEL